ncbi:MAG: MFS transporter [Haloarculaceae archaeon]
MVVAALAMGLAGTYQFLWSTLREPLSLRLGAPEPALGAVFTVYVVTQTLSQFPAGWIRDRYGPRLPMLAGAVLLGAGFAGTALLESLPGILAAWAVGGIGVGIAYTVAVNTPVKWFTDRRGLATGLVTMSFGGTSFLLIPVIRSRVGVAFEATLLALCGLVGTGALVAAFVLRDPGPDDDTAVPADQDAEDRTSSPEDREGGGGGHGHERDRDDEAIARTPRGEESAASGVPTDVTWGATWREAVRTWQFWLLYAVALANNLVGLVIIGKTVTFAAQLGLSAGAATLAASLVAIGEAGGVLAGGVASDRFGYRPVAGGGMVIAGLSLGGGVLAGEAGAGIVFAVLLGAAAVFRTPIFAVFPALVGDYYGPAHSSQNYALLYSAKLWGGLGAGVVASAVVGVAGWSTLFLVGAGLFAAAGLAMWLLRPVDRTGYHTEI